MGLRETGGNAYLALYSSQLFLAVEHAVEFTHAGRARPRPRQRPIDIPLPHGLYLHPHQESSRGSVHADARSSQCVPSASHEPP